MRSDARLSDFGETPPRLVGKKPIPHPQSASTVIGMFGVDKARGEPAAYFPRTYDDHFFRKLKGYGISEQPLDYIRDLGAKSVYIIEQGDDPRLIEYDAAAFYDAALVLYNPDNNEALVFESGGDPAGALPKFSDRQRVVPTDEARAIWTPDEASVTKQA